MLLAIVFATLVAADSTVRPPASSPPVRESAEILDFRDFFEASPRELKPSARLLSLNGKRVRLVGFMAQMEMPPRGAFYLCSRPVFATEAGAGTADLPPEAVLVIVRTAKDRELDHIPRAVQVTGILEVGPRVEEDGQVSALRLILDAPDGPAAEPPRVAPGSRP